MCIRDSPGLERAPRAVERVEAAGLAGGARPGVRQRGDVDAGAAERRQARAAPRARARVAEGDDAVAARPAAEEARVVLALERARALDGVVAPGAERHAELAVQREDDLDEFTGKAYSKWTTRKAEPGETRAVFVDEFTCIGCKQCVWAAPATFRMEDEHGRSRVYAQWLNSEEDIDCAIASCPVDCIHWVQKEQLPYLEHVTRFVDKVSVGIMQSGQGRQSVTDPFDAAYAYQKFRERKIEQRRLKLEEERRNREWAEANARTNEASAGGSASDGAGSADDPDAFSRRRDYGKAVGRIMETWAAGTGVKMETMKRRRWVDSGATIPLERALVPLAEVERMNAEMEKETVPTSR